MEKGVHLVDKVRENVERKRRYVKQTGKEDHEVVFPAVLTESSVHLPEVKAESLLEVVATPLYLVVLAAFDWEEKLVLGWEFVAAITPRFVESVIRLDLTSPRRGSIFITSSKCKEMYKALLWCLTNFRSSRWAAGVLAVQAGTSCDQSGQTPQSLNIFTPRNSLMDSSRLSCDLFENSSSSPRMSPRTPKPLKRDATTSTSSRQLRPAQKTPSDALMAWYRAEVRKDEERGVQEALERLLEDQKRDDPVHVTGVCASLAECAVKCAEAKEDWEIEQLAMEVEQAIAQYWCQPRQLQVLRDIKLNAVARVDLSATQMDADILGAMLEALIGSTSVTELILSANPLFDEGIQQLAEKLFPVGADPLCRISVMDLRQCGVGASGGVALLNAAKSSNQLKQVLLSGNPVAETDPHLMKDLQMTLALNTTHAALASVTQQA